MSSRPRKERKPNADKRRRQLLDATIRSIVEHGLAKTTLSTVANEAGLSQGVAVFYFKTKDHLLAETLRLLYSRYEQNWQDRLAEARTPEQQLAALVRADFAEDVCNTSLLSVWFAFWGAQRFSSDLADISMAFDSRRHAAIVEVCELLLTEAEPLEVTRMATWIDTLTDGYWFKLHLHPAALSRQQAFEEAWMLIRRLLPVDGR